jgi:hypothetical protein
MISQTEEVKKKLNNKGILFLYSVTYGRDGEKLGLMGRSASRNIDSTMTRLTE